MPITQDFLDKTNTLRFSKTDDINNYFQNNFQKDFILWFRENIGEKSNWEDLNINSSQDTTDSFNRFWQNDYISLVFSSADISLLQFLSLQGIIINETGGLLTPISEKVNSISAANHPGIAYAFDAIAGLKHSYNTLAGNKTCFDLFNDPDYLANFNGRPLSDRLANTTNVVWQGELYPTQATNPADPYPVSTDPTITGFVLEADFYKFRGRGLIQTTSRDGYKDIIDFVLAYMGANQAVVNAKATWGGWGKDNDGVATMSANAEWDELFMNSDLLVASEGISLHNAGHGNYLGGIDGTSPDTANASIRNVGKRISGGNAYADLFLSRVVQIIEAMS